MLNIDNPYFAQIVSQIYSTELHFNNANLSDTEASFLDLDLSITNGIVSTKIYYKRDDSNFEIVNFPFLDGDVPRSPSFGEYISQLIRFARVCSHVDDFNNRSTFLTSKLLKQGYPYQKLCILRKTIEGYLDSIPSLTFNTIKTLLIMHAFHSSRHLQSKWMLYFSHA